MKHRIVFGGSAGMALAILLLLGFSRPGAAQEEKPKSGPLNGTWECMARGGSQGDTSFTLELSQDGEKVTGSVSSPQGGMDITTASFKHETLEIHLDTPEGNYVMTAKLKEGRLTDGATTLDGKADGTWEGKKAAQAQGKPSAYRPLRLPRPRHRFAPLQEITS
jgi:hypothetical protein